ncbi:AAA family ATPase [Sphingobium sp. CAP-1]|nr:AAA family ATPase [Sphingobium sp. CAP-1]
MESPYSEGEAEGLEDIVPADDAISDEPATAQPPAAGPQEEIEFRVSDKVVVLSDPTSAEAEAIAAVRTHLLAHHVRAGRRGLALCAPNSKSGSTFMSVNLAVSLARAGIKTLLIDADMRSPSIHKMIVPSREVPALRDCLANVDVNYGDIIQEEVLPSLSIIYAGRSSTRAQELLSGQRFKSLLDLCMREFEVTIIDTPASNSNADGRRIASVVRYCIIVARKDKTYVSDVSTLIEEMKSDKVNVIGTVLNEF